MRNMLILSGAIALGAAPGAACPYHGDYGGYRFSSLMSEYQAVGAAPADEPDANAQTVEEASAAPEVEGERTPNVDVVPQKPAIR